MACGATSPKKGFWLVLGLIAFSRSQPVTNGGLQEGLEAEVDPQRMLRHDQDLQEHVIDNSQIIANTLDHVFRQGRELQVLVDQVTGRQTAATLATSLGDLIRPAITAFVGALSMNSATSITNAITALLGGRSLDLIPASAFMTVPTGRDSNVQQPTRDSTAEELKRRPLRRKQKHSASTMYTLGQ